MNSEQRYRDALRGLTPSPDWQKNTLEAMKAAQGKRTHLRSRPMVFAAAAAVLALAVTGGVWWSSRMETGPDDPGVARTPEPAVTLTPSPNGPIWNDTFSIVTDASQAMGNNPTVGRLEELAQLPVYENPIPTEAEQRALLDQWVEVLGLTITKTDWYPSQGADTMGREPTLEAECTDGAKLRLSGLNTLRIYDAPDLEALEEAALNQLTHDAFSMGKMLLSSAISPGLPETAQETLVTYFYTGEPNTTRATYLTWPGAPLEEQVYVYSFHRVESTNTNLTIYLPPAPSGVTFPLRPAEDAVASFRSGDYWGSDYTAYPDRAEILQVTIEYDTTEGQPYFQPVYRILYTQDYWDEVIADWMSDGAAPASYMGVGVAYIPAIDPEYQDEVPYRRYFNDGLAHFTQEDLP